MKYLIDIILFIILASFFGVFGAIAIILGGWGLLILAKYHLAKV
jgi:ABC-type multidrug transport system permease subunit